MAAWYAGGFPQSKHSGASDAPLTAADVAVLESPYLDGKQTSSWPDPCLFLSFVALFFRSGIRCLRMFFASVGFLLGASLSYEFSVSFRLKPENQRRRPFWPTLFSTKAIVLRKAHVLRSFDAEQRRCRGASAQGQKLTTYHASSSWAGLRK